MNLVHLAGCDGPTRQHDALRVEDADRRCWQSRQCAATGWQARLRNFGMTIDRARRKIDAAYNLTETMATKRVSMTRSASIPTTR
jgi:hypothetical protein